MIYHNPPTAVLGRAEVITFFDVDVPGWKEVVVNREVGLKAGSGVLDTINIPVNSRDAGQLQTWRDRIAAARAAG